MNLEQRIRAVVKDDEPRSMWEPLISIFRADPEAFYLLACNGVENDARPIRDLAKLAADVRTAVRNSYEIEPSAEGAILVDYSGNRVFIPINLVKQVSDFLREVDGKVMSTMRGKDYEGTVITEAEARFKLGSASISEANRENLEKLRTSRPYVLRISQDDLNHLFTEPAYVTHELLNCARRTILAPTRVFRGLHRGDDCLEKVDHGWAFCGKPRQAYGNDGRPFSAPDRMVFVVYANEDLYVFDWDWVKENPGEPGCPLDPDLRFENPGILGRDVVLELPKDLQPGTFDATQASYSEHGDCIFCYLSDDVSYADRINGDLTIFRSLNSGDITGFKIKNVRRILQKDRSIVLTDAPGLTVSVDAVLLASLRQHKEDKDARVDIYSLVVRALLQRTAEPPKVTVPDETESHAVA